MSGLHTRSKHPILWFKSVFPRFNQQTASLPKSVGPRASTILPCRIIQYTLISEIGTVNSDLGSSLEDDGFVTRAFRVCKCAYGLGALVFKPSKQLVELLDAERLHEPFAEERFQFVGTKTWDCEDLHIWAGEFIPGVEAQACVFYKHGATNLDKIELINLLLISLL